MRGVVARSSGRRRAVPGAWHKLFNSASGVAATLVLDYWGAVGGRFFANDDNNLTFDDLQTFTRASLAMQKDASGTSVWVPHNFTNSSEDISTSWNNTNTTDATNVTTAPNGTLTADKITENGSPGAKHFLFSNVNAVPPGVSKHSAYFKANTRNHAILVCSAGGQGRGAIFDIASGTVAFDNVQDGNGGTVVSATGSIVPDRDGWFLCTIVVVTTGINVAVIGISDGSSSFLYNGDNASSIYVWGIHNYKFPMAPANDTYAPAYVPTSAPVFQHRLDHDKDGNRVGLLAEEARTNICLFSDDWTNAAYNTVTDITALKDQTGADGVSNSATSLLATSGNALVTQAITSSSATRVFSVHIKRITGTGNIELTQDGGSTWLDIKALINSSTYTQVATASATVTNPVVGVRIVTDTDKIAVQFGDAEVGAFVTSPIPTTTVAVARAADVVLLIADASLPHPGYNQTGNTATGKLTLTDVTGEQVIVSYSDGTTDNRVELFVVSGSLKARVFVATNAKAAITLGTVTAGTEFSWALSWIANALRGSLDGATEVNDTTANTIPSVSQCNLNSQLGTTSLVGRSRWKWYYQYPTVFSGSILEALAAL